MRVMYKYVYIPCSMDRICEIVVHDISIFNTIQNYKFAIFIYSVQLICVYCV